MDHISASLASLIFNILKTLFTPVIKILKWLYEKSPFKLVRKKRIPKLGIIENPWKEHRWDYGKRGEGKIIGISTSWMITNTLPYNLTALSVYLTHPEKSKGSYLIKDPKSNYWGHYTIEKGYTTEIDISFAINPKHVRGPEDTIKAEIEIQDAIGRIHKIDKIIVCPIKRNPVKNDHLIIEDSSKLSNEIEKKVVSILKNEVQQYKFRGRREGRLGTIDWPRGTVIDYHNTDGKIQYLFENSNKQNVSSEHISALQSLFHKSSKNQQEIIINCVLARINKKAEYRDVGYLILFFLFEAGYLKEGLNVSLKNLSGDKANGFSDVLRLLDILLAFRFDEFGESDLNEVENFIYSAKEHPFSIKERINAIRIRKLLKES